MRRRLVGEMHISTQKGVQIQSSTKQTQGIHRDNSEKLGRHKMKVGRLTDSGVSEGCGINTQIRKKQQAKTHTRAWSSVTYRFRGVGGLDALALVEETHGAGLAANTLAIGIHQLLELGGGLNLEVHFVA